jgi:tRNA-dihydrouridine synthase A
LSENAHKPNADIGVVLNAAEFVDAEALASDESTLI